MKKRIVSAAMALILCLTLLPAAAWAEEADPPDGQVVEASGSDDTEKQDAAAEADVAEVTSGGTTTQYADLSTALAAAKDGDTIKLLAKAAVGNVFLNDKTVTLDLNGKTVKNSDSGANPIRIGSSDSPATLIITGSSSFNSVNQPLVVKNGTLDLSRWTGDNSYICRVTISGANSRLISPTGAGKIDRLAFIDSDTEQAADTASLNGGRYDVIVYKRDKTINLGDLLAEGYAFRQNGTFLEYARELKNNDTVEEVEVVRCTSHVDADGDKLCDYCNTDLKTGMVATSETGGTTYYYTNLSAALSAAKAGDTLTLLTDVKGGDRVTIDKAITFDLNGHRIYALTVKCKIILKDSAGGTGKIAEWLRVENDLTIGDLLEEGYALRNADTGAWYGATEQTVGNVSVRQAPITSVTLTALNADGTAASTSIPYGTTGGIKLSANCTRQGAGELSCQWYTIGGTLQLIDGATEPVYQLPADLSAGRHTYRVTFTADGYTKSADITITVAPADLSQGAVVFKQVGESMTGLNLMGNIRDGKGTFVFQPSGGNVNTPSSQTYCFEVYHDGQKLIEGKDYTIKSGNTAQYAGDHTLTIQGKGSYTGTATHTWRIEPYKLTRENYNPPDITKVYDGTTGFDFSKAGEWGSFTENVDHRPNGAGTGKNPSLGASTGPESIFLTLEDFKVSAGTLDSPDMPDKDAPPDKDNRTASFTIELKTRDGQTEPNFVFEDGGSPTIQVTGAAASITKAKAPTDLANGALTVYNGTAKTYEIDIASLLPSPGAGCRYGKIYDSQTIGPYTYKTEITEIKLNSSYYDATANKAKIEKGKLILPIRNVNTTTTGKIGTITLNVISQNYHQIQDWTIDVSAANQPVSSSGGGGGGSSSGSTVKTDTVTNPDGSVTKTETKSDGTVVETTTGKDGSTTKTETKKDGSSVTETKAADGSTATVKTDKNGQTEAKTALSNKAIEDAKKSGEPVKAPVEVKATRDSDTAPTVKVELPKGAGETKVEIPVSNVKPGTVAVLVHADGTEEIVKNSLPTEDGIQLTVNGGATVKIVDNSKDFIDTRNHWAKDAIDFVSARGLVNGMNDSIYAPNASTTRAQLWTILARQNDADLTGGANWYEKAQLWSKDKGISDGTEPNAAINRAQMVTMLWRAVGSPAAQSGTAFQDVAAGSYYAQAVAWAVEGGITAGVGGGRFDPAATCTRAQIATFLYRLYLSR